MERVACLVASGLARRGFGIEMLVLEDDGPTRELVTEEVRVRVLPQLAAEQRRDRMAAAVPKVADYLAEHSPRLFHAPGNHTIRPAGRAVELAGFGGVFVPKITNPLVGKKTSWWKRRSRKLQYRNVLRRAQGILVLSPAGVDEVAAVDRSLRGRARFIHNPYVSDAMLGRAAERKPANPPVILSVGRLSEQKNQALLLRAAVRLRDRDWRIRLCGVGPDEPMLRELAAELGIAERVEFAGFVSDPIPEYLRASVSVQASRWEGLPATVLEAIACGCPVVATASSSGLVNLLHEVGARKPVKVEDETGLASAIQEALDGRLRPVPPEASLPYGINASLDEHAAVFGGLLEQPRQAWRSVG